METASVNTWGSAVKVTLYKDETKFSIYDTKYELVLTERHEDDGEVFEAFRCFSEHDDAYPVCKVWRSAGKNGGEVMAYSDWEDGPSGIVRTDELGTDPRMTAAKVVAELG